MGILNKLFGKASFADEQKVKVPTGGEKAVPDFLGKAKGSIILNTLRNSTNLVLSDSVRSEATINATIKKLVTQSPDLSLAVESKIKAAIPSRYTAFAVDELGRIDSNATKLLHGFITRFNYGSYDYTRFTKPHDLRSISASLLFNSFRYGSMMIEVVLGKTRVPAYFKSVSTSQLEWADDTPYSYPIFKTTNGQKIPLNYPTIFYSSTIQDNDTPYADSPLIAAIQACMWDGDFMDALRRAAIKNLMPRLKAVLNSEKFLAALPEDIHEDPDAVKEAIEDAIATIEGKLQSLEPEDVIATLDYVEFDTIQDSNRSEDRTMNVLAGIIDGKIASGSKTLPSILGRGQSSSAASTESLLYLKHISHSQQEINNLLSRALTYALRVIGNKGYAKFAFEDVNLRPAIELASFKAVEYAMIQEQLSMGQLTDEEACIKSTGNLPPVGYENKSGTMFKVSYPSTVNDYSNTSASADGQTNSTQTQKDSGDTATKGVKSR